MVTRGFGRAMVCAVVLAIATSMSGCSLLTEPPPEVTAAIDTATEAIRQSAGVAEVTADIYPVDLKDGGPLTNPDAWTASITVEAEASGVDVRALAGSVGQNVAVGIVSTRAVLRIPGENGDADAQLTFTPLPHGSTVITEPDEMADAALALRELGGARSVTVFDHGDPAVVRVDSADRWAGLTEALRALPGFGLDALSAVTLHTVGDGPARGDSWLTIDTESPQVAFVRFLGELSTDGAVFSVSFTGIDTRLDASAQRPALRVQVSTATQVTTVAGMLTALEDADTTVRGVPRATFEVATRTTDPDLTRTGYLGLPLGSAEPDDRVSDIPDAAPLDPDAAPLDPGAAPLDSLDPAAAAAQLEGDRALVSALLDAAGDAAGIRGPATVTIGPCGDGANEQVHGSVIIPIFEIADSADEAFDAITTAWERRGITKSDRAMGTDFYTAADDSLDTLSIRGGTAGISITVTTPCIVTG